jgi:hypothetical protein
VAATTSTALATPCWLALSTMYYPQHGLPVKNGGRWSCKITKKNSSNQFFTDF